MPWIERTVRVLKNSADVTAERPDTILRYGRYVMPEKHDAAGSGIIQAQYTTTSSGLAAPAFSYQAKCFVLLDKKTDIIHSLNFTNLAAKYPSGNRKVHFKILYFNYGTILFSINGFS